MSENVDAIAGRSTTLDSIRGCLLLVIAVDHISPNILAQITPHHYSTFDMADIFVLVSGVSCGIAYGKRYDASGLACCQRHAIRRAAQLYLAYVTTALFVLTLDNVVSGDRSLTQAVTSMWYADITNILQMKFAGGALPVLRMYMILLLATPGMVWMCRRHRSLLVCVSMVVYAYGLYQGRSVRTNGLFLNPVMWQVVFVIGVASSAFRDEWTWPIARRLWVAVASACIIQGVVVWRLMVPDIPVPYTEKANLGVVRVAELCALVIVASRMMTGRSDVVTAPQMNMIRVLGRAPLLSFCTGECVVRFANWCIRVFDYQVWAQITCTCCVVACEYLVVCAYLHFSRRYGSFGNRALLV